MASFADALRVLNEMKQARVVEDYAVAGAMGARTLKRRERAAALKESPTVDTTVLAELLGRFGLEP